MASPQPFLKHRVVGLDVQEASIGIPFARSIEHVSELSRHFFHPSTVQSFCRVFSPILRRALFSGPVVPCEDGAKGRNPVVDLLRILEARRRFAQGAEFLPRDCRGSVGARIHSWYWKAANRHFVSFKASPYCAPSLEDSVFDTVNYRE